MVSRRNVPLRSVFMGTPYAIYTPPADAVTVYGAPAYGDTDHERKVIRVGRELDSQRFCDTLIHEVLHQALWLTATQLPEKQEEAFCTLSGTLLAAHIKENPQLWRWMINQLAPRTPCQSPTSKTLVASSRPSGVSEP